MDYRVKSRAYKGKIAIPASKSDAQRAILLAALANGRSSLINIGKSADELAMLTAVEKLGATVSRLDEKTVNIESKSGELNLSSLSIGESGLGLRLLTAIMACQGELVSITGDGSLLKRKHDFFETFFPQMGVEVSSNDGFLPISVKGPLKAGNYIVDGSASSQYISGLLIAFTQIAGVTNLKVHNLTSRPYVDMTLATMKQFGLAVVENEKDVFTIFGKQDVSNINYTIDGDWSAASFWLVASALGLDVSVSGLSMASKQADKMLLNALMQANCRISNGEDGIIIDGSNRRSVDFDATHCPDLFPALATYGALTPGLSKIRGVHRLANKESDRSLALQEEFKKLGVSIEVIDDEMHILGVNTIQSCTVKSHNDHRIAMCLAIVAMASGTPLTIEGAESVAKSYPNFWKDVEKLIC